MYMEYVLIIIFIVMLCLPILIAYKYNKKIEGVPMQINQNISKELRYFGKSFSTMVKNANIDRINKTIKIRNEEDFFDADSCKEYSETIEDMILGFKDEIRIPPNVKNIEKEIYSVNDIYLNNDGLICKAVFSEKNIYLKNNTTILRWVDCEGELYIENGCNLGQSATSKRCIYIKGNNKFKRLYAPVIYIGSDPLDPNIDFSKIKSGDGIIAKGNIESPSGIKMSGDIKGFENVEIGDHSIIKGNIFSEKDLNIGENCVIYGDLFSQGKITIGKGTVIGKYGQINSVVARKDIKLKGNNIVYGHINCEKGGELN